MTGSTTRVGTTFGHYELQALLGHGGMGEVYRAYDRAKDRVVALKILSSQCGDDETFRERFRRESHAAARLQEPHVVPIHDWGDVDGVLYIDMRLVNGADLHTLLQDGPLPPDRAVAIIGQIAAALDAAHAAGLIHRDVKPANVLVTPEDFAYLVDFGIAEAAGDTRLTSTGTAVGSFGYMAPERFGISEAAPAADVYSLACVLYEALVGTAPYPALSLQQVIAAHVSAPVPHPSRVNPAVSAAFDAVIARGMAKEPHERFLTAGALAHAARQALRGAPPQPVAAPGFAPAPDPTAPWSYPPFPAAGPPAPTAPTARSAPLPPAGPAPTGANWLTATLIGAAALLVAVAIAVVVIVIGRTGQRTDPAPAGPVSAAATTATSTAALTGPALPPPSPVSPPAPVAPQVVLPAGARVCPATAPPVGAYATSAAGTRITSCEFAEAVRDAYGRSGPPSATGRSVRAFSPVTKRWYVMTCIANTAVATCSGGNDAVVYLY